MARECVARCRGNLMALRTIRPRKQIVISRSQRKVEGLLVTGRTKSFQYSGSRVCLCRAAYDNGASFLERLHPPQ